MEENVLVVYATLALHANKYSVSGVDYQTILVEDVVRERV